MTPGAVFEVVDPGLQTTVQAWPGRLGLTSYGYSSSGPMDHVSFRAANVLAGNPAGAPAFEIPMVGFCVAIQGRAQIAVTGPEDTRAFLDDTEVPTWETVEVPEDAVLRISSPGDVGFRAYVAIAGALQIPEVYGSAATSLAADVGGVQGRALVRGDRLTGGTWRPIRRRRLSPSHRPRFATAWEVEILRGPYATPDHLTEEDWTDLLGQIWRVDLNSDRIATRLHPHRFRWARPDGGIAGGHPSNILDTSYPRGGVLANGDVLTILGTDSYTSGGFSVVATVPHCAIWKVGQLRPGRDTVRFREVDFEEAQALNASVDFAVDPARMETAR